MLHVQTLKYSEKKNAALFNETFCDWSSMKISKILLDEGR